MLITELIYELKFHKFKITILFFSLLILSLLIIKFGQSKYIKQLIYIDIKDEINFYYNSNFDNFFNSQYNTEETIKITRNENNFFSPNNINYALDLNKNSFYSNLLDNELRKRITSDYRPGYNILVYYDLNKKRYEITVQLFDDELIFNKVIDNLVKGINEYFSQEDLKNNLAQYFSNSKNRFIFFENNLKNLRKEYLDLTASKKKIMTETIEKFNSPLNLNDSYVDEIKFKVYIEDLKMNISDHKRKIQYIDLILDEYNDKKNEFVFPNNENFYDISLSKRETIIRGKFPEYIVAFFLISFISISFLISYFSLNKRI